MWKPRANISRIGILSGVIALTLGVHYGWLIEPFFGHVHWLHAIHGRFCYIPIVISAAWFGIRGGLIAAAVISVLLIPYLSTAGLEPQRLADELVEVVFYFGIGILSGALIDREMRARRRAQEARLQLERSQKLSLVGQIAAGMAHEIKNPLASIKGAVEILGDESTSEEDKREFRGIVIKEIKRINRSLMDFLEFARPSDADLSRIDISETIEAGVKQVERQAHDRGVIISKHIEGRIFVDGDEEKIHQVMLNLLINALEASDPGSTVHVRLAADGERGIALVTVDDHGPGIPESDKAKVFEPFFSSKPSGTGLGLAIAKSIVERHGGAISLEGKSDGGTVAAVELPLSRKE